MNYSNIEFKICQTKKKFNIINYMKLKAKEQIKVLLSQENIMQKDLVKMLAKEMGKNYLPTSLSQKLSRGTISYNEVLLIADILGYDIEFKKREEN